MPAAALPGAGMRSGRTVGTVRMNMGLAWILLVILHRDGERQPP